MQWWIAVGLIGLVAGRACAQRGEAPPPPTPTPREVTAPERALRSHSDAVSRDLFTSCDTDGDDRLDVFECSKALDTLRDSKDAQGFARIDQDRDGFVTWPEFDAQFRSAVQGGGSFRVRPARRFARPASAPQTATPLQQFLQLHDGNQSGGLDPNEVEKLLRQGSIPAGPGSQLRTLDLDRSGEIDEAELAPWFEQLKGPGRQPLDRPAAGSLLPMPWNTVDANQDNLIDAAELAQLLRAIDPALARWSEDLLRALDKSKDGKLQPSEAAAATTPPAATTGAAPLPKQTPLR